MWGLFYLHLSLMYMYLKTNVLEYNKVLCPKLMTFKSHTSVNNMRVCVSISHDYKTD